MRVVTSAGLYSITQSSDPQVLRVVSDTADGLQAARDGLALMEGGEDVPVAADGALYVHRTVAADWISHEVRQYVTYQEIGEMYESLS